MITGYRYKYVCKKCSAIHYYRPKECQRCGSFYVERKDNMSVAPKEAATPELRLEIDRLRLDEEWTAQPKQFLVWSQTAADCQLEYDKAKAALDVTQAELSQDIRNNCSAYGLDKVTEKAVETCIPAQPDYQLRVKRVNEARHALEVARAAVNALEHRKRALTMLTELFIRDYYSDMTVRRTSKPINGDESLTDDEKADVRGRGRRRLEQQQDGDFDDDE